MTANCKPHRDLTGDQASGPPSAGRDFERTSGWTALNEPAVEAAVVYPSKVNRDVGASPNFGRPDLQWLTPGTIHIEPAEFAAVSAFRGMLADADWLMPLVAAQRQYRAVYYGLTAAALLEDVWTDALANWLARHRPSVGLVKVDRGLLGDYVVGGLTTSHKSGLGPQTTAVHWDATATKGPLWSSETAVTYLSAEYGALTGRWLPLDSATALPSGTRVVWPPESGSGVPRKHVAIVQVTSRDESTGADAWSVVAVWPTWPSFEDCWRHVAKMLDAGTSAFDIEMMWLDSSVQPGNRGILEHRTWPGVYLWPISLLQGIPLVSNNRGSTLEKATVASLMRWCAAEQSGAGLFVRMPVWSARYAPARPPDLYLALRNVWDQRFSPVRGGSEI